MADLDLMQGQSVPPTMVSKYKDMGDGTHALVYGVVLLNPAEEGSEPQILLIDDVTGALATIPTVHHEVHESVSFISDAQVDAASLTLAFRTPNTVARIHLFMGFASESKAHLDLVESPTWTASTGTQNPVYNRDRNSNNVSVLLENTSGTFVASGNLIKDPVALAGGTVIHDFWTWSDKKQTVQNYDRYEMILKQDTQYAARLTSDDGNKGLQVVLNWYEVDAH